MTIQRVRSEVQVDAFANGAMIHLFARCWRASGRLDDKHLGDLPVDLVRATYDLLKDKTLLEVVWDVRGEADKLIGFNSLPCPIPGLHFVPKRLIPEINEKLKEIKVRFWVTVDEFISDYARLVQEYAVAYPELYEPSKYLSETALRGRFYFEWTFRHFSVPDVALGVLPPELYEEEMRKFKQEMRTMADMAVSVVGQEFLAKIKVLKDQCLDPLGNVNTATVNAIHSFLDRFDRLWDGYVGHSQLKQMIAECREYMVGTDAPMLRADDDFRQLVGRKMGEITGQLDGLADARLHRRLNV